MTPHARPLPPHLLAALVLLPLAVPGASTAHMLSGAALAAAFLAAAERRTTEAIFAAGISLGLSPLGLAGAPLAIGCAVRHGRAAVLPVAVAVAVSLWLAIGGWPGGGSDAGLAALVAYRTELAALATATGIGVAAWAGALASMRGAPLGGPLYACAALTLMLPAPTVALVSPVACAIMLAGRHRRRALAANDNPLWPRPRRARPNLAG